MDENKNIIIYKAKDNKIEIKADLVKETLWLNLNQIAELFQRDKSVISRHISNIYSSGELEKKATVVNFATVQKEGTREISRNIDHFNLGMIISVGYRVNSKQGTQFRIWAANVIRQYLVDGYAINQKRLEEDASKYIKLQAQIKTL
ncbi:MAG: RhuM family protein [Candidatus Dojkabacteria bacterium]|nr:RhuM family protein [Candidatus Dojkabacteria bacterium]MDQ7020775.1 RhuM family protein [Candidatus Dojkabacteria bacterium]